MKYLLILLILIPLTMAKTPKVPKKHTTKIQHQVKAIKKKKANGTAEESKYMDEVQAMRVKQGVNPWQEMIDK